jgi:hypothetical protein
VADADTGHGRNGFYFGANGEHSLYDVGKEVGTALVALGKSESAEPTEFTQAELDKYFGVRLASFIFYRSASDFFAGLYLARFQFPLPCDALACYWLEAREDHERYVGEYPTRNGVHYQKEGWIGRLIQSSG